MNLMEYLIDTIYVSSSQPNYADNIKPKSHMETDFAQYFHSLFLPTPPSKTTSTTREKKKEAPTIIH